MDKKEIDGRPINAEVARPKQEKPERREGEEGRRPRRPRGPRKAPQNNGTAPAPSTAPAPNTNTNSTVPTGAVGKQEVSDKPRRPRTRRPRREEDNNNNNNSNNNNNTPASNNNNININNNNAPRAPRAPRPPRAPRVQENRLPSDTTIFVANLAWSVENNTFAAFLTAEGLKFKNAYVVKRRNGSSRGYGFIEFDSAADQKVALEKLEKKQYEGRELAVKVALAQPPKVETAPAPAPAATN
jgi:hypothetical protein